MTAQRGHFEPHVLVVTVDRCPDCKDAPELCADCVEEPLLDYSIECPGLDEGHCHTYLECIACSRKARDDDSGAFGEELDAKPVHGVQHAWISGLGWCTPAGYCYVQTADGMPDAASYVTSTAGRYAVDWDTGDPGDLELHLLPAEVLA